MVPEAYKSGEPPLDTNYCEIVYSTIRIDGLFQSTIKLPSAKDFIASCHDKFDGNWTLDRTKNHNL